MNRKSEERGRLESLPRVITGGRSAVQKWEYCVITGVTSTNGVLSGFHSKLHYLSIKEVEQTVDLGKRGAAQKTAGWGSAPEGEYIAYTVARLGQEGWERTTGSFAVGNATAYHSIYFCRPIQ